MSKALFLSNVGNRDLGKDKTPLFDNKPNKKSDELKEYCREEYKKITGEDLKADELFSFTKELYSSGVYRKLDLEPIIIKYQIKKILELHDSIDVVLFGTLQNGGYKTDAYYSASIIEYIIKKEFGDKINSIKVYAINDNPSDYSLMFEYYKKTLNNFKNDKDYESIYLGITGGTPALSFGLIICGALKWELKAKVLYQSLFKNEPTYMDIGYKLFNILKNREYITLYDKHLYELCAEIGKDYNLIPDWKYHYLLGLHYKELFDFKRALEEFDKAYKCDNVNFKDKKEIQKEINSIKDFEKIDINNIVIKDNINLYAKLIDLLIENAKIKWENGEYVDFIGRIFRLKEALLRMIIEKEFNISTNPKNVEENGKKIKRWLEFEEFLDNNPKIYDYLEKETDWNGRKEPNNRVLDWILGYMVNKGKKEWKKYAKIYGFSKNLEKLSELRNESILAHGFKGISKTDIVNRYDKNNNNEMKIISDLDNIKEIISELIDNK
ncbi:hypothetical protein [Methanothermococcus okinawensis]|uniref:Uncharacterized protein n=1 Tax=Methanothermococcus okinawensis (strain DSM 14208 / JCM 11175 / IH1) TaxID=647113 RepID=F8AJQ9_METOI|nr:hypothetical protein [Methanothermococcus okinawensis]AEH07257.1 hypothetical protein Metok_1289 [Methanothermococcus okinawensis IH1]